MNKKELLSAQFKTYVFWSRTLKENNQPSWTVYVFQAQKTLNKIKLIESKEEVTKSYGNILLMGNFKKVA